VYKLCRSVVLYSVLLLERTRDESREQARRVGEDIRAHALFPSLEGGYQNSPSACFVSGVGAGVGAGELSSPTAMVLATAAVDRRAGFTIGSGRSAFGERRRAILHLSLRRTGCTSFGFGVVFFSFSILLKVCVTVCDGV
jgi:hypothetical protein